MTRWSHTRVTNAAALLAWAGLFWFLILDERLPLYLSTRTSWLAYLGAVAGTLGALGYVLFARTSEPLTGSTTRALAILLLPVVLLFALPPASLGAYAASRRTAAGSQGIVPASSSSIESGDLSLVDVAAAQSYPEGRRALVGRAGDIVSFVGFVSRGSGQPADEFTLTRFMITCCPGDALSVQIRVAGAPPGKFKADEWVRVSGKMYPLGDEVIVDASEIVPVRRPDHPYLNP